MDEILDGFKEESKALIDEMLELLEEIEGNPGLYQRLEEYGIRVDRIMGTAKSLASSGIAAEQTSQIGAYCEICKIVGYKGSQVGVQTVFDLVVAFLLDATELLKEMTDEIADSSGTAWRKFTNETFLDRLRWLDKQLGDRLRATVGSSKSDAKAKGGESLQREVDEVLKQLGIQTKG